MATNPTLLSMPLAKNGQKNVIPATQATAGDGLFSQSTGFPAETSLPLGAGGVAPSREDFNGMANLLGGVAYYAQKGWQFKFDAGQDYFAGCIVRDTTTGLLYECINDVPAGGSVPSSDSVNWHISGNPVGTIIAYAGAGTLGGWLNCDGSAISRTSYSNLFSVIGTTYGAGDGSTTFNLPNLIGRYPQGDTTAGTVKAAGLPNITGFFYIRNVSDGTGTTQGWGGSFSRTSLSENFATVTHNYTQVNLTQINFDASQSNSIYGASDTVTPPTLTVRYMIKYA